MNPRLLKVLQMLMLSLAAFGVLGLTVVTAHAAGNSCSRLFEPAKRGNAGPAVRLSFSANQVITQRDDSQTCTIYALFHSINLGAFNKNPFLKLVLEKLESDDFVSPIEAKFSDFESYMAWAKSKLFKNQSRLLLNEEGKRVGVETGADMDAMLEDVNQMIGENIYRQGFTRRNVGESDTIFLERIQSMISLSLTNDVPPIISYSKSTWSLKSSKKKRDGTVEERFTASQTSGHAITLIGVSEIRTLPKSNKKYFRVQAYEQVSGAILELDFMVDSRVRAVTEITQTTGRKKDQFSFWKTAVVGEIKNEKGRPSSPYLSVFLHSRKNIMNGKIDYSEPSSSLLLPRTLADMDGTEKHVTIDGEEPLRSWDDFSIVDMLAGDL